MSFREEFASELSEVIARAASSQSRPGTTVMAVAASRCSDFDPVSLFAAARWYDRRIYWSRADEDISLVGVGTAAALSASGGRRFEKLRIDWDHLVETTVASDNGCPLALPAALGGFAFSPEADTSTVFPGGLLILPRLLFVRAKGEAWVIAAQRVPHNAYVPMDVGHYLPQVDDLLSAPPSGSLPELPRIAFDPESNSVGWKRAVEAVLAEIWAGEVEKVVLARAVDGRAQTRIEPASVLQKLNANTSQTAIFAFASRNTCFLGASPERLVRMSGVRQVSLDCLAGSITRGCDEAHDKELAATLLGDPKEQHEHDVVLRAVGESLRPLCEKIEHPSVPSVRQTATVQHLHTPVRATARSDVRVLDLVEALHPTPATGGYPRTAALASLARHEDLNRGWYAGPVGWLDASGNGDFAVAIRSALLEGDRATLYAGSGIVAGSDPDREYEETNIKLRTMRKALSSDD